jgi:hypothetical protein
MKSSFPSTDGASQVRRSEGAAEDSERVLLNPEMSLSTSVRFASLPDLFARPFPSPFGSNEGSNSQIVRGPIDFSLDYVKASFFALAGSAPRSRAAGARTAISSTSTATAKSALSRGIMWARKPISGAPTRKPP